MQDNEKYKKEEITESQHFNNESWLEFTTKAVDSKRDKNSYDDNE